ncbi:MAG: nitroreductase family protein [Clostridia bacterium]|nr:nitroreductase family protein [Clostridia bacterium]
MKDFASLAITRRSIRKFADQDIPLSEIEQFIRVATSAPSGCNSQCWKFIVLKDKGIIKRIEEAVISKSEELLGNKKHELSQDYLNARRKAVSFFSKAPVVVAVFMTKLDYYDPTFVSALKEQGYDHQGIMSLTAHPDLLSIGAAVQNLLLAVHEKGYGACWMNEPAIAAGEIGKILGLPEDNRLISLIPIGVPAYTPREKKMKDFDEVFFVV